MKKIFIHNAFFRILAPPAYGILVYLLILLINNDVSLISETFMGQEVYVCIGLSYLVAEALRLNVIIHDNFFPTGFSSINRLLLQSVTGIFITITVISLAISAYFEYVIQYSITETQLIVFNSIYGLSSLLFNLLYFSNIYMYKQNVERLNNERVLTESLEAELAQFKNEINPMLLYDALESLITLVHKNTEEAEDYIDNLSAIYRHILSHRHIELSSLKDELKAVKHLIFLLNYKHDNNIEVINELSDPILSEVPLVPGTLPMLIEHIVRTTIITKHTPLIIKIYAEKEDNYIVIQSKLNDRLTADDNGKRIFENLQQSYSYYTERPMVKVKAYDYNYFKIPLMELKEEVA
ncbi:histidine kinase [Fulvivirga sp. RKSG066]|uniref:histidine kinase n=1 Tax=Fulvivirga aurantia TaxID=2529383 RepID=UPI0012BC1D3E|nr:sensor histidine kinase [Fulvivirga aurantia]MTI21587.1 histidine kinase [Fulvivirga aurantia]